MFHEMWTAGIYEIIAAMIGATISGIILLQVHHSKVKQELKIHREKEVFERKQMSRTVSARIPTELHEDLRERCNLIGESINDFVKAAIEIALYGDVEFDFGEEESKSN